MQGLEKIWAKNADPKVPEWPCYGNLGKVTQNPHFLKKCKGGTKGNFSQIAQKVALVWKAQKHCGKNNIILYLTWAWSARTGQDFGAKSGSKSARMAMLWEFRQGHQKPAFSEKEDRGDQWKFFKNRSKSSPHLKGPKALWRKWHYPLISMHLNCKDWKRIRRKQQLQKCPNGQIMAIFEKSPKSRIFWKSTKGEPREIFQRLEKIEAKTAAPKVPEWPSYGNFRKVTQKPHFPKKCKGGTKGNFPQIAQ